MFGFTLNKFILKNKRFLIKTIHIQGPKLEHRTFDQEWMNTYDFTITFSITKIPHGSQTHYSSTLYECICLSNFTNKVHKFKILNLLWYK